MNHLSRLRKDLAGHRARLKFLRQQITVLSDEASAHEAILAIAQNERVLAAIEDISHEPGMARRLAQSPDAFLQDRGIELPSGATLTVKDGEGRTSIAVAMRRGEWQFSCVWDSTDGFMLMQPDQVVQPSSSKGG